MKTLTYYEIFGIPQDASPDEIKSRYKILVLKFHPDRERSSIASEAIVLVNNAYEVLSDPQKRIAYDASLKEPPNKTCYKSTQAKRSGSSFGKIFNKRKIPALIAIIISIAFLTGYQIESLHGEKTVMDQFMKTNHHYYTAVVHEALAALPLFVPVFGIAWGVLASFTSGLTDKAVIMMAPSFQANVSSLVFPYVILAMIIKLAAYYIGMCRSLALANAIRIRRFSRLDKIFTQSDIVLVILLSSIAGIMEHAMVNVP